MIIIIGRNLIINLKKKVCPLPTCFFWHVLHCQFFLLFYFNCIHNYFMYIIYEHYTTMCCVPTVTKYPQSIKCALKFKKRKRITLSTSFSVWGCKDCRGNIFWFTYIMQNQRRNSFYRDWMGFCSQHIVEPN